MELYVYMFDACKDAFLLRKSVLILKNSADPDEMQPLYGTCFLCCEMYVVVHLLNGFQNSV